jgi:hypothetical protein
MQCCKVGNSITLVVNYDGILYLKLELIYSFSDESSVCVFNIVKCFSSRPEDARVYSVHLLLEGVLCNSYNALCLRI